MASKETYEEYVDRTVNAFERAGDKFSSADERLTWVVRQLEGLAGLKDQVGNLNTLLSEIREVGYLMPQKTQQIVFQQTLLVNTGIRLADQVPLDGLITSVTMHFPLNCNGLVDIAFGHNSKQIIPIGGFIALNDACPVFPTHEECKRNEEIWCIMDNHDGGFPHTVACIVTIEGN